MKQVLTLMAFCLTTFFYAQESNSPTLQLTGTKSSFQKGDIDTEILLEIIQQKQQEIKERVFRNIIIKQFNKYNYTERLNNFTTYNYLYKLMDNLTSGKNKTVMTKNIIENSAEFAFVYGLTLYSQKTVIDASKIDIVKQKIDINENNVEDFNINIDMCLDILLSREDEFLDNFNFKETLKNNYYKSWYNNDNKYIKVKNDPAWQVKRKALESKIETFFTLVNLLKELPEEIRKNKNFKDLLNNIKDLDVTKINSYQNAIINFTSTIDTQYTASINSFFTQLTSMKNDIDKNFDNLNHLLEFYIGLEKSKFKDFTLTKDQYYAMKFIVVEFIEQARLQYKNNDVISGVLDFMLENTFVEYNELEDADTNKGYLYMDIESLIFTIDGTFGSIRHKGVLNYITPFLSMGANYASFNGDNDLTIDSDGNTTSLSNMYFASEKIGVKVKLWNWKYTRSFKPGEDIKYYGFSGNSWKRPQPEPLFSDFYIFGYGSGLLYNLIDIKSEDSFEYAIFGTGVGFTFFNGLAVNFSYASPLIDSKLQNGFFNVGMDIPIIEYISAVTKKRNK